MHVPEEGPFFLEIFAGEAGLTEAVRKAGGLALPPIEIEVKGIVQEAVDLFDPQVLAGQDLLHPLRDTMFLIQHCSQG